MLEDLQQKLPTARTDRDRNHLSQKAASLDRQIDDLVYRLYNLTEEEIALVEAV